MHEMEKSWQPQADDEGSGFARPIVGVKSL